MDYNNNTQWNTITMHNDVQYTMQIIIADKLALMTYHKRQ